MLNKLLDLPCDYLIIDRTPFWDGSIDRLCVQRVPPSIYPASYPVWVFPEQIFLHYIQKRNFEVVSKFQSLDLLPAPVPVVWKGMILERKNLFKSTASSSIT
jgi:hypothetical protein